MVDGSGPAVREPVFFGSGGSGVNDGVARVRGTGMAGYPEAGGVGQGRGDMDGGRGGSGTVGNREFAGCEGAEGVFDQCEVEIDGVEVSRVGVAEEGIGAGAAFCADELEIGGADGGAGEAGHEGGSGGAAEVDSEVEVSGGEVAPKWEVGAIVEVGEGGIGIEEGCEGGGGARRDKGEVGAWENAAENPQRRGGEDEVSDAFRLDEEDAGRGGHFGMTDVDVRGHVWEVQPAKREVVLWWERYLGDRSQYSCGNGAETVSSHAFRMSERYEIKRRIGQGGVGAVYEAFDTLLNRGVAIKRLLSEEESEVAEGGLGTDLTKEAAILSSLHHPNIITLYDIAHDEEGAFVVMELIDGETIEDVVKRGAMTEEDFGVVVEQTLGALVAAQEKSLLHRDIKPTNIMVQWLEGGGFQTKILDFGLAKYSAVPALQTVDHGGAILGSIYFLAPEQFERIPLDPRTDLYALGCVFYYCLTKSYPFDGESAPDVMMAHLEHRVEPLEEIRPDLPGALCAWVMRLMSREMDDRPSDARAALKEYRWMVDNPEDGAVPVLEAVRPPAVAFAGEAAGGGPDGGTDGVGSKSGRLIMGSAAPSREQLRRSLTSRSVATLDGGGGGGLGAIPVAVADYGAVDAGGTGVRIPKVAVIFSLVAVLAIVGVVVAVLLNRDGTAPGTAPNEGAGVPVGPVEKGPVPVTQDGIPSEGLAAHYLGWRGVLKGEGEEANSGDVVWGWEDQAPYLGGNVLRVPEGVQGGGPIFKKLDKAEIGALKGPTPGLQFSPGDALGIASSDVLGIPNNWEGGMSVCVALRAADGTHPRTLRFFGPGGEANVAKLEFLGESFSGGVGLGEGAPQFSTVKVNKDGFAIVTLVWDRGGKSQRLFSRLPKSGRNSGRMVRGEGGPDAIGRWEVGGAATEGKGGYAGEIFELAVYNRGLSGEEVDVLEGALAKRYFAEP